MRIHCSWDCIAIFLHEMDVWWKADRLHFRAKASKVIRSADRVRLDRSWKCPMVRGRIRRSARSSLWAGHSVSACASNAEEEGLVGKIAAPALIELAGTSRILCVGRFLVRRWILVCLRSARCLAAGCTRNCIADPIRSPGSGTLTESR